MGALVAGVSRFLRLAGDYRDFFDLAAARISAAIANARTHEAERRRAEALAELDRAKTSFFSNVSHEFRTPLTLMLGPIEDLKAHFGRSDSAISMAQYQQIDLMHRNSLRLLKLVNTLLDFSRIEAGRVQAVYEETNLAALTAELASVFRSAIEKAGLKLIVDCETLPEPAYVAPELWEKIVLNLLSNAFKFTFQGEIEVKLLQTGKRVELSVRDTGTGIPEDQLPKIFERFNRVPGAQGRTHEGTGIGLALVQELARLHGGSVSVESTYGKGSTFRVFIPLGKSHLPHKQIGAPRTPKTTALGAAPCVEEALHWLPDESVISSSVDGDLPPATTTTGDGPMSTDRARILLADDNADMRGYVRRLLSSQGYEVEAVADGEAALHAARAHPPGLVLTDVMMPKLDGFGLVRELRNDPQTRGVPIILVSARAGEESRVEGFGKGADDYLIKPFGARELLARVSARLELARLRGLAEKELRQARDYAEAIIHTAPDPLVILEADLRVHTANEAFYHTFNVSPAETEGRLIYALGNGQWNIPKLRELLKDLVPRNRFFDDFEVTHDFATIGHRTVLLNARKLSGIAGAPARVLLGIQDITEILQFQDTARKSQIRYQALVEASAQIVWTTDATGAVVEDSPSWRAFTGQTYEQSKGLGWLDAHHPDDRRRISKLWQRAVAERVPVETEYRLRHVGGEWRWTAVRAVPVLNPDGSVREWVGMNLDITGRKRAEEALRESEAALKEADRRKDEFLGMLAHELRTPLSAISNVTEILGQQHTPDRETTRLQSMLTRQTRNLTRMVDDLLDISRITSGKIRLEKDLIALSPLISRAVENTRSLMESRRHELIVSEPDAPLRIAADATRLEQILVNLLSNAAKYTEPGGRIHLTAKQESGGVCLRVRDNGIGISAEMLTRVFEMFT
ncbi:MAG: ATP-binding protein, partial [Gammaproteobacteria bacterium]